MSACENAGNASMDTAANQSTMRFILMTVFLPFIGIGCFVSIPNNLFRYPLPVFGQPPSFPVLHLEPDAIRCSPVDGNLRFGVKFNGHSESGGICVPRERR